MLHKNNVETFFSKAADSENDQPNDNGPNASLKSCCNEQKGIWDEKHPAEAERFTPQHMNRTLTLSRDGFPEKASLIIKKLKKTRLCPLQPQTADPNLGGLALTASLQTA